jgi:ATP diphosphatase
MQRLLEIMARLRDPIEGCPWDREQTFATIAPHTIEEAYEVADAIRRGDWNELRDELGDLLFQVVFYAQLAREEGIFDFQGVVEAITEKMLRRHPHVFGEAQVADVAEQRRAWERHKAQEREERGRAEESFPSRLDGVAEALPALARAGKLQQRAAEVGFDWPEISGVFDKLREELAEVEAEVRMAAGPQRIREEIGDLLFACVNLARHTGVDAETALRDANHKFTRRFQAIERTLAEAGSDIEQADLAEMDALWERAKREQAEQDRGE